MIIMFNKRRVNLANLEEKKQTKNLDQKLIRFNRFNRNLHKWVGLAISIFILTLAVTGIMLNHKKSMGYMPDVKHEATGDISQSMDVEKMVKISIKAANNKDITTVKDIDRIDYRTKDMYAKVRFKDTKNTEVIVDTVNGEVLNVGYRTDAFIEKLHTGAIFGDVFTIISDVAAIALVIITFSGIYILFYPKWRRRLNKRSIKKSNANLKS